MSLPTRAPSCSRRRCRTSSRTTRAVSYNDKTNAADGWLARQLGTPVVRRSRPLVARYGYHHGTCQPLDRAPLMIADHEGWTWLARVRPQVYAWTRLDLRPGIERREWAPAELHMLTPLGRPRGADVTWRCATRLAGDGYLLAGDAAAVVDPASSHGVLRALMSGIAAANAAARMLPGVTADRDPAATSYAAWLTSWFEHDIAMLRGYYGRFRTHSTARADRHAGPSSPPNDLPT